MRNSISGTFLAQRQHCQPPDTTNRIITPTLRRRRSFARSLRRLYGCLFLPAVSLLLLAFLSIDRHWLEQDPLIQPPAPISKIYDVKPHSDKVPGADEANTGIDCAKELFATFGRPDSAEECTMTIQRYDHLSWLAQLLDWEWWRYCSLNILDQYTKSPSAAGN